MERIERAIEEGWLAVVRLNGDEQRTMQQVMRTSRLDEGEAEAVALAIGRKAMLVVDDKEARAVAGSMGITYLGSAAVLLEAFLRRRLAATDFEDSVRDLGSVLWLSPAVVAEILRRAREAK